jgi:PleD family two-component response regulator
MKPIIEKERERFDRLFAQNAALIVASSLLFLIPAIVLLVFLELRLSRISASYRSRLDDYLRQLIEEKERTEEAYTQLKLVADRDFLTGLWTRRVVLERLNRETEPGAAGRFCVLIADTRPL